jgi:hypothetical protein
MSGGIGPSATGVFVVPNEMSDTVLNYVTPGPYNNTIACSIDATWIPSEAWIDPTIDDIVHEAVTDPLQERYYFEGSHRSIKITSDWLNLINILYESGGPNNINLTTFETIANQCILNIPYVEDCMEASMALFLADAMARVQASTMQMWMWQGYLGLDGGGEEYNTTKIPGNSLAEITPIFESWLNNTPNDMTKFSLEIYQYGYGYGMKGSNGIYVAVAVLLIHVVFALAHVIIIMTGGWSSGAWNNPGELIALAVNSSPSKLLQNTCAGIEDPKTWTRIVSVRETTEAHLEIIFEEDNHNFMHQKDNGHYEGIELGQSGQGQDSAAKGEDQLRKRAIPGKNYGKLE